VVAANFVALFGDGQPPAKKISARHFPTRQKRETLAAAFLQKVELDCNAVAPQNG